MIEKATQLFERLIGYKMRVRTVTSEVRLTDKGFPLDETPIVELLSVQAKTRQTGIYEFEKFFGSTDFTDIPIEHCVLHTDGTRYTLTLPSTLFGTNYDVAKITYKAGLTELPKEVSEAIEKIARMLENGDLNEWNLFLPEDCLDAVEKYRKGD